jgi:hypothetical protein
MGSDFKIKTLLEKSKKVHLLNTEKRSLRFSAYPATNHLSQAAGADESFLRKEFSGRADESFIQKEYSERSR